MKLAGQRKTGRPQRRFMDVVKVGEMEADEACSEAKSQRS